MDTQNASVVDVPDLKLAKVGAKRDKKRAGAGWLSGGRGAGSAFSGAAGGAGAGGGVFGTGMSLAKLLTVLLVSGGLSAGAWQVGNMMAGNSSSAGSAAPKVFADKGGSQKYDDLSGVIKGGDRSIPNSLGYVNNDGLTDEQRAAKKAAEDAAAAKAAADAQAKADAEAKEKALADAKAASATPDPSAEPATGPAAPKLGLGGNGKFGAMSSGFGGGGGLSGGAGLSGGINRGFASMGGLDGHKAQAGALSAFRSPAKAATTRASGPTRGKSNSKGFAKQQLDMANGLSRTAAATGKSETASSGAATPFDNNGAQGTVISGPGLGNGTQAGPSDSGGTSNPSTGLGGPLTSGAACQDANFEPDINGNCTTQTTTPPAQNGAKYQGLLDAVMVLLGIVAILSLIDLMVAKAGWADLAAPDPTGVTKAAGLALLGYARMMTYTIAALGAVIAGIGLKIASMQHGDFMIGAIVGVVGGYVTYTALADMVSTTTSTAFAPEVAHVLIASALGELASASAKSGAMM